MSRFSDDVNRVFDELLRTPWGRPTRPERRQDPGGTGLIWEVQMPVPGADPEELDIAISRGSLTVTLGASTQHVAATAGARVTTEHYEGRRETFALPAGYRAEGIEARIVDHQLKLRVHLLPRGEDKA